MWHWSRGRTLIENKIVLIDTFCYQVIYCDCDLIESHHINSSMFIESNKVDYAYLASFACESAKMKSSSWFAKKKEKSKLINWPFNKMFHILTFYFYLVHRKLCTFDSCCYLNEERIILKIFRSFAVKKIKDWTANISIPPFILSVRKQDVQDI